MDWLWRSCHKMKLNIFFFILFCFHKCLSKTEVQIASILPRKNTFLFSIDRMKPALELGIEWVMQDTYLKEHFNFHVIFADSNCSIAEAMHQAIEIYMNKSVNVFFGPACNFAVAPIARQVKFWNTPLVSIGATARDFSLYKNKYYPLLTRVGPANLNYLPGIIAHAMDHYKWKILKLLYYEGGFESISKLFCKLVTESLHYEIRNFVENIQTDYYKMDDKNISETLMNEIGNKYAGK
uniref:Receptor ligand binding region domain-containing protein n=2 Tax=Octopus bimaculoides TaxID=37653 RepID=A0A0L8G872_OCTBM